LNRTTLGIGLTSLLTDWSHDIATSILPLLVASLGGYVLAAAMALLLAIGASTWVTLAAVFILAGIFTGIVEALEDSLTASLVPSSQHGMAFGTLAAVNAGGDFASSILIGGLWALWTPGAGFAVAAGLFVVAALLVLRLKNA
jgi:MFS family permease